MLFKKGNTPWNKGIGWKNEVRTCLECSNEFSPWKADSKFCSKSCATAHRQIGIKRPMETKINMSLAHTGEKEFTGFKQKLAKRLRNSSEWKVWREKVFKRDDWTCRHCNDRCIELHPHHIITVSECIKGGMINMIFEINNGMTLCVPCHREVHRGKRQEVIIGGDYHGQQ